MTRFYTAGEASERLGVSRNTLYAYVSRGLIRSEPTSPTARTSRYYALDVDRLATGSRLYKSPAKALQNSTDWGVPILESSITLIADETFYYRGQDVPKLAEQSCFEEVLALLWKRPDVRLTLPDPALRKLVDTLLGDGCGGNPIDLFLQLLALLNREDLRSSSFTPEATIRAGVLAIHSFVRILTGAWPSGSIAGHLKAAWQADPALTPLLDSALVLVADHELNISTFTARCSASAGCSPYAAVAAATHAFWGRRHGGNSERIRGLFDEACGRGSLYDVIKSRMQRGEALPGFGHRLYDEDPRSRYLLPRIPTAGGYRDQTVAALEGLSGLRYPTVDYALIVMEKELALPERAGSYLFYLGRLGGLIAHILEQYAENRPIRPRANYIGVMPERQ